MKTRQKKPIHFHFDSALDSCHLFSSIIHFWWSQRKVCQPVQLVWHICIVTAVMTFRHRRESKAHFGLPRVRASRRSSCFLPRAIEWHWHLIIQKGSSSAFNNTKQPRFVIWLNMKTFSCHLTNYFPILVWHRTMQLSANIFKWLFCSINKSFGMICMTISSRCSQSHYSFPGLEESEQQRFRRLATTALMLGLELI